MTRPMIRAMLWAVAAGLALAAAAVRAQSPLADAHIHYSHDAWDMLPPAEAIKVLRQAGLKKAFVSSSSDQGTQMLYEQAPDLIVPVLRPYRRRGETGTWFHDDSVADMVAGLLAKNTYAGIGEFHLFGENADLPVPRRMVQLAAKHKIFLHAHSDADAIARIFLQDPDARVLWAHSGFDQPAAIAVMLRKYKNLWSDLAFRSDHASDGKVDPEWRRIFMEFPDRFLIGTDTFAPERWYFVIEHAAWSRAWLAGLPKDVGENIAYRNAETLANWALGGDGSTCASGITMSKDGYRLSYGFEPAAIQVGRPFAVRIAVCAPENAPFAGEVRVGAAMPAHGHGMNYKPAVQKTAPGLYYAQGLMLHMRGHWQFNFQLLTETGIVRLGADHQQK
ncbi:MAG: amidohydrolase [Proteobacteria bacterium]|nr:amidohydrolase [Pseudomonadota bacterium]